MAGHAKRKLSAIFSADVKGYSLLMGEDEFATVQTLNKYRQVMTELIQQHRGRVVDSPGDNILAEFESVVDAVDCAVKIQVDLKVRNAEMPDSRRMEFRIGINLGDVIEEDGRLYGDGVNITARIEKLAGGGGICISGTAYDQVGKKLPLGYEYLGEQEVKNIEKPVRVYRVLMEPEAAGKVIGEKAARLKPRAWVALPVAVLFLGVAALIMWNFYGRSDPGKKQPLPLPEKASIAVLPFTNLSGDPDQGYFSDGLTNDLITDLSRFRELFVIASNTVFTYKGRAVKIKELGQELGVRYVLEGSVQKMDKKVRVNAQLIDAITGEHLWAERYDRDLKDLFAIQNEIIQSIVTRLAVKIDEAEQARAIRKKTESLDAYDYKLRGMEYFFREERSQNKQARQLFERAIKLDPHYASAYVALALTYFDDAIYGWTEFPNQALQQAHDLALKALEIDKSNAEAHAVLGRVYISQEQYDLAISELQQAIDSNPNDAQSYRFLGSGMLYLGRTEEAIRLLEASLRFDRNTSPGTFMNLGLAYYLKGRYEDSLSLLKRGLARKPDFLGSHIALAAAYSQLGHSEEAASEAASVLRLDPFFELESYGTVFRNPADRSAIIDGLRKAGLK
ncbi:MAG: adenylate/guanylate cyclase domain-containing protein [Desulfobaccales bacterium]